MQRSCQNSSLSPSVPLDIWFQSFKKKSNHNNTLAPFCYLIAPGSWFNKFKYYSSWFFGIETFFNLILRSLLGETETISKYSDIIFTPECSRSGHQKYCRHHLSDRTVFLFSEAKWSQSLSDCVLFLTEMQHEILLLDIVAEIFQRPNRYLVTALSI